MATRTYCDQCGNTIREPNVFLFGPKKNLDYEKQQLMAALAHQQLAQASQNQGPHGYAGLSSLGGNAGNSQGSTTPPKPMPDTVQIDLCDVCMPIWMARVKKLTSGSDPD